MDEVLVSAGLVEVLLVVELPSPDRNVGETSTAHRDPAAGRVIPHHHLGPDTNLATATETEQSWTTESIFTETAQI